MWQTCSLMSVVVQDNRVVVTKPFSGGSPAGKGQPEAGTEAAEEGAPQGAGRGPRKQLMVTMAGKKVNTLQMVVSLLS